MIMLSENIQLTEFVQPVCFPNRAISNAQVRPGTTGDVSSAISYFYHCM